MLLDSVMDGLGSDGHNISVQHSLLHLGRTAAPTMASLENVVFL